MNSNRRDLRVSTAEQSAPKSAFSGQIHSSLMNEPLLTRDGQPWLESFGQWRNECQALDHHVEETLAALDAYQSHLDAWQGELAAQRESLQHDHERISGWEETIREQTEHIARLEGELAAAREQVDSLSSEVQQKSDELRSLQRWQAERVAEESSADRSDSDRQTAGPGSQTGQHTSNAVLGSVLAQFDKLRQQQAMQRTNSKNRQ